MPGPADGHYEVYEAGEEDDTGAVISDPSRPSDSQDDLNTYEENDFCDDGGDENDR